MADMEKFVEALQKSSDKLDDYIKSSKAAEEAQKQGVETLKSEMAEVRKQHQELAQTIKSVNAMPKGDREIVRAFGKGIVDSWRGRGKAASEGSDSAGGYLVEDEIQYRILSAQNQYGAVGQLYGDMIVPMMSDVMKVPVDTFEVSGVSGTGNVPTPASTSENAQITGSADAELSQLTLTAAKYATLNYVSNELLNDSFVDFLGAYLMPKMARQAAKIEDTVALSSGILGSSNVQSVVMDNGDVDFQNITNDYLIDLQDAVVDDAISNGKYIMHRTIVSLVRKLKDSAGQPLWVPMAAGEPATIDGYPYMRAQIMPAKTASAVSTGFVIFGDVALGSVFGRRLGRRVDTSRDFKFDYDQVAIRQTFRIAWNDNANIGRAIAVLKTAAA